MPLLSLEHQGSIQLLPWASADFFFLSLIMQTAFLKPENVLGLLLVEAQKFPGVEEHIFIPSTWVAVQLGGT